ncbi:hypothetical protein M758_2G132700 [Ceratodon purpureus]|nr:hypothetical protein M758_2G132700 [Ceratodon purpureus]
MLSRFLVVFEAAYFEEEATHKGAIWFAEMRI